MSLGRAASAAGVLRDELRLRMRNLWLRCIAQSVGSDFKKSFFPTPTEARAQARGFFFWRLAPGGEGVCFGMVGRACGHASAL